MVRQLLSLMFVCALFLSQAAFAGLQNWQIIPAQSRLSFIGMQNGEPAGGYFKSFSGDIQLDRNNVRSGHVKITVDMRSIEMTYADFTNTLTASDWLNVGLFPDAVFEATQFKQLSKNNYQANGTLTIRDKSIPIRLTFAVKNLAANTVRVIGKSLIRRSMFGIGDGQYNKAIKDEVVVNFVVTAVASQ